MNVFTHNVLDHSVIFLVFCISETTPLLNHLFSSVALTDVPILPIA